MEWVIEAKTARERLAQLDRARAPAKKKPAARPAAKKGGG